MIGFSRRRGGAIVATFTPVEAELVSTLAAQLEQLLAERATDGEDPLPGLVLGGSTSLPDDPALARLFPDAYADAELSSEFRQLTERGLAHGKVANARFVAESVGAGRIELDEAGAQRWMRSIGDMRLTLAARIGIDDDDSVIEGDDETLAMYEVYSWLAGVQDSIVRCL
ncbi:DUF2017 domain-containing protein [soil metagenome]